MTAQEDWEQLERAWTQCKQELLREAIDNWPLLVFLWLAGVAIAFVVESLT